MLSLHYTLYNDISVVITKYSNNLYKTQHLYNNSYKVDYFTTKIHNFELQYALHISIKDFEYSLFNFNCYGDGFRFNLIEYSSTDIIDLFTSMISENSVKKCIQNTTKNELNKLHSTLPSELVLLVKKYI